jgi:hypothetical protein
MALAKLQITAMSQQGCVAAVGRRLACADEPRMGMEMQNRTSRALGIVAAMAFVGALGAGTASAQQLSQADVEAALKGNTFNTKDFGETGTITWGADGTISIKLQTKSDTGTYRFAEGGYCSTWTVLRTNEKCFTLKKAGDGKFDIINPDGSLDSQISAM